MTSTEDDRGSVLPLLALVLAGFVAVAMVIAATARHQVVEARAGWAADAAALAAAAAGPGEAGRSWAVTMAEANGAELTGYGTVLDGAGPGRPVVVVEVRIDAVTARSAARRVPVAPGP